MTVNTLVEKMAERARILADRDMRTLKLSHPDSIEDAESTNIKALRGQTRGDLIEAILVEEFSVEFDCAIEEA